jgi:acyl-CoA reductase-like NAD-dependent aldehyde dehydrogenase
MNQARYDRLFVGGEWTEPAGSGRITVRSASTEEVIGSVPEASEADVELAVEHARRAFDDPGGWATWEPNRRAEAIMRFAGALDDRADETSRFVSAQNGMPITVAEALEGVFPAALLRYYAGLVRTAPSEERRSGFLGGETIVTREPVGVVAAIVPWNFPQSLAFFKLAPALAAGATVVVKPSPETVLDSFVLAEAIEEAQIPPGVVNVVPAGRKVGAYLVSHPEVDKVAFTGSTSAGRAIAETCGRLLRPVTLELGGKSAAIVLDDAELGDNVEQLVGATLLNNGQTCFLGTRILAPRSRYDEIVELFVAVARALTVGDALDPSTALGPMASERQRDRVESYIVKGKNDGARLVTGGGRPAHLERGWFVEPTVFSEVDNRSAIAQEEIFGPVLSIIAYRDVDEAVQIANASDYGLGGSVWSADPDRAMQIARQVKTGTVGINHYLPDPAAPFGGVKASGIGRELGPEGLAAYQNLKSIYV